MDLITVIETKRNSKILIDGTVYTIGQDLTLKDIPEEHAAKLLQNPNWSKYDPSAAPSSKRASRSPIAMISTAGEVLPKEEPEEALTEEPQASETPSEEVAEEPTEEYSEEPTEDEDESDGEGYPEPSEDLDIELLREMAELHQVTFNKRTGKKTLVARLQSAIYG